MAEISSVEFYENSVAITIADFTDSDKEKVKSKVNVKTDFDNIILEYSFSRIKSDYPSGGHGDNIQYSMSTCIEDVCLKEIVILGGITIQDGDITKELIELLNSIIKESGEDDIDHLIENIEEYDTYQPD